MDYEHGMYAEFDLTLDEQLERAKRNPFKVAMDFKTRYRVWKDQVLLDRLMRLRKEPTFEAAIRYYDLTLKDYVRLFKRATKEFFEVANDKKINQATLKIAQEMYAVRRRLLFDVHNKFLNDSLDVINGG